MLVVEAQDRLHDAPPPWRGRRSHGKLRERARCCATWSSRPPLHGLRHLAQTPEVGAELVAPRGDDMCLIHSKECDRVSRQYAREAAALERGERGGFVKDAGRWRP